MGRIFYGHRILVGTTEQGSSLTSKTFIFTLAIRAGAYELRGAHKLLIRVMCIWCLDQP